MTPALTKIFKDGCGIPACASSVRMDSEGSTTCCLDLKTQLNSVDDDDLQKLWPLLSSFPPQSSCLPMDVLSSPAFPLSQDQVVLLPCASPLPGLLSVSEDTARSQQDASVFPGGLDMFERNCQEACLLYGRSPSLTHGPGGGDVPHVPLLDVAPSVHSQAETKHQGYPPVVVPSSACVQEDGGPMGCLSPPSQLPLGNRVASDHPAVMLTDSLWPRVARQVGLQSKAQRLQKRLQVLLGEHAVQHCDQQLNGLKRQLDVPASSRDSTRSHSLPQRGCQADDPGLDFSLDSSSFSELGEFIQSNQAVLRGLQGALDSEATLSSSSDEEHEEVPGWSRRAELASRERWFLEERADLGSRWSWLQVRLADLEQRTQQMEELHKLICSTKGKVVLAESQPLTDMQIQQTLLREMAGLSCTAVDTDNEPCSPTRLLYNIERQSAQLSQFVNSLMPPLSFSPVKQPQSCKRQKVFPSGRTNEAFPPRSSSRRRLLSNRTCKAEMSCVCARTRPLVSFHKPRLFALCTSGPTQDSGKSMSPLFSSHWSSPSLRRSSSDAVVPCCTPDSSSSSSSSSSRSSRSSRSRLLSRTLIPTAHAASCLTFGRGSMNSATDTAMANLGKEEWSLRRLTEDIQPYRPAEYTQRSSTPVRSCKMLDFCSFQLTNSADELSPSIYSSSVSAASLGHKLYNQRGRHPSRRVLDLSPIEAPGSFIQGQNRRANQKKRKQRHIHRPIDDEDFLHQLSDTEDSSDGFQEQRFPKVPSRQTPQGLASKRQGENIYNINNIVIHTLVAKIEKLQYKDIITPRWRVTDPSSVIHQETEDEEGQEEDLADDIFAQRHLALEHGEKSAQASWGSRKCRKHRKSNSVGQGGGMLTSGEESSAEWCWAQLDTDEEQRSEEWLLWSPWERRMFPLNEDEEKALFGDDNADKTPDRPCVPGFTPATPKNSNSHLSSVSVTGASLPSGGQNKNS